MESDEEGNKFINSDNIFSLVSSSPTATIQNPKEKFTFSDDDHNLPFIIPKEEYEMMSMIENGSGDGSFGSGYDPVEDKATEQQLPPAKKKRLHRHTVHQIQEMEALFKENPHPDNDQRVRLSQELGLTPLQIKFWFQNKRTQTKTQQDRRENVMLKAENNTLKTENYNLHSDLKCLFCPSCDGSSGYKLRLENSLLRQKLAQLRSNASLVNSPPLKDTACFFPDTKNTDLSIAEEEKAIAMDLAVSCVQELAKMCETNEPLWIKKRSDDERVCLNEEEYNKMFHNINNNVSCFRREASRAKAVVIMNSISLVNTFIDADKWSEMFCSIVARAKTIQIISSEAFGASGSLLLMNAEFQAISPLVPIREVCFLRYVEQNAEEGKWMIVDFPIDRIKPTSATTSTDQYQRKPSGCIVQEMADGYSQVTWVEHMEVEEKHVQHEAVREYVKSGAAFGAERWLAVLQRQCERMASLMATNITDLGVIPSVEARRNLMKLSQTMVRAFCLNMTNSNGQALSESTMDRVRIITRKVCDKLVPCAVSTTFLPYSHHNVFDLLRDIQRRSQILFNEDSLQEIAHIATGSHPGNCISLLRNNVASDSSHNVELILQETCIDNYGSLVVYSTVDPKDVQLAMNGQDLSSIPLLPLGFAVLPLNPSHGTEGVSVNSPSCLLTVVIQVNVSNVATARLYLSTVDAVNKRLCSTFNRITSVLGSSGSSVAL